MHLQTVGMAGALPTVLIEAGNSMSGAAYARIVANLAPHVQVIAYDRAGLGWSGDIAETRDAEHICEQLRLALQVAGVGSRLVIAGHSIGGLFLRVYAGKFPDQVVGAVFLDATHPRSGELFEGDGMVECARELYRAQRATVESGRLHESDCAFIDAFADLPQVQQQLRHAALQVRRYDVAVETLEAAAMSSVQAQAYGDLGDRPMRVIAARTPVGPEWCPRYGEREYQARRLELHEQLASLSTRGRLMQIADADHGTLVSDQRFASMVADEILEVAKAAARELQ